MSDPTNSKPAELVAGSVNTQPAPAGDEVAAERPEAEAKPRAPEQDTPQPSFVFFGVVSGISLLADVASKAWAEVELSRNPLERTIVLLEDHLTFTLAYNPGGAWGLLTDASEAIRKPFFFLVSILAIAFIISLYGRVSPQQRALKWGLPLVLGGALGNLSDRIMRSKVIDFIDYRADWVEAMNRGIGKVFSTWGITDHWPTFNVADISICIGVGLMAVDMFTSRRPVREEQGGTADSGDAKPEAQADAIRGGDEPGAPVETQRPAEDRPSG